MKIKDQHDYYIEYKKPFSSYSDEQLVAALNSEVGNAGWGTARGGYLSPLHEALIGKEIDYSAIGDLNSLSFRCKIVIKEKKIEIAQ